MFTHHIYLIYMHKPDLVSNNLQVLICHKTKPNQTKPNQTKPNQTFLIFTHFNLFYLYFHISYILSYFKKYFLYRNNPILI